MQGLSTLSNVLQYFKRLGRREKIDLGIITILMKIVMTRTVKFEGKKGMFQLKHTHTHIFMFIWLHILLYKLQQ